MADLIRQGGFERFIRFYPAYDKRSDDPLKDYGIHCVDIAFFLKGPQGVIQFVFSTGWYLPHIDLGPALHSLHYPMGVDIGYHSPKPTYEGQTVSFDTCEWMDGEPCYYDGSSLNADPILKRLIADGEDAVWEEMGKWYEGRFAERGE
jgi:hypothetical protein